MASADAPGTIFLALRGSGQGMFVGLADDCTIVASEPYGVVEETSSYVRMDGEQGGEIVVVSSDGAGTLDGVAAVRLRRHRPPVGADDVVTAEVTTRDINRGDAPHFLLKEISEAPRQLRQDAARQDRRSRRRADAPRSATSRCRPTSPPDSRTARSPGSA